MGFLVLFGGAGLAVILVEVLVMAVFGAAIGAVFVGAVIVSGIIGLIQAYDKAAKYGDEWRKFHITFAPASSFLALVVFSDQLAKLPLGYGSLSNCYETDTCSHPVALGLLIIVVTLTALWALIGGFVWMGADLFKRRTRWADLGAYFCFLVTAFCWAPAVSYFIHN